MMHGKQGHREEALKALAVAEKLNPRFAMVYFYRGNVFASAGEDARAAAQYRRALALDSKLEAARRALAAAEQRLSRRQ